MGTLFTKIIQVLNTGPFILYLIKGNKLKKGPTEPDILEDEWGQFCDIEKPLHKHNRDKPS